MTKRPNPLDKYARFVNTGVVQWIGVRPKRKLPLQSLETVDAVAEYGLAGDHRMIKTPG